MYFTNEKFEAAINDLLISMLSTGYKPTVILGIQRGGLVAATYLSHRLNVPMQVLDLEVPFQRKNLDYSSVLLVDDICDTGETLVSAHLVLCEAKISAVSAVLVLKPQAVMKPHHHAVLHAESSWVVFPWEAPVSIKAKTTDILVKTSYGTI